MEDFIKLEHWEITPDKTKVQLKYEDGSILYVTKTDFDRAFGCIISLSKEEAETEFAIKEA